MYAAYLWLIPVLPLIGAIIAGGLALGGARTAHGPNKVFVALVTVFMPFLAFATTCGAAGHLAHVPALEGATAPALVQDLWTWFHFGSFSLTFSLLFDGLSSMMLLFITGIGSLICLYSVGYMWSDRGFARFMTYLNLFLFSMVMLVLGGSLPVTFLGWEGVGLCSYLLVGFWHHNTEYNDAARKAFVVNRVGDLGFLLGAFAIIAVVGSLDYQTIAAWFRSGQNASAIAANGGMIAAAALLLFFGCTGKSAQIPLLTWLPDAMAGPTPVSALIHAATMVTSGVYLVARLGDLYVASTVPFLGLTALNWILVVGCATALWGAVAGLFQNDIKKALAYSTVSQLGFMFMACGVAAFDVGLFHVVTHAFFKAALFLGAGMVIHLLHHEQDMRKMGGLWRLPEAGFVLKFAMFWSWWAILGLPFGAGFFSKDLILEKLLVGGPLSVAVGAVAVLTAAITAVYMTRMMVLTFWSPSRLSEEAKHHLQPIPLTMQIPVFILGAGAVASGLLLWSDNVLMQSLSKASNGLITATNLLPSWLSPVLGAAQEHAGEHHGLLDHHLVAWGGMGLAFVLAVIGLSIAFKVWGKGPTGASVEVQPSSAPTGFGAAWTWAFDRVYGWTIIPLVKIVGTVLYYVVEVALIGLITWAIAQSAVLFGGGIIGLQRSRLRSGLAIALTGVAVILVVLLLAL